MMNTRATIFLVLVASGLVAERDPRLVRAAHASPASVPVMSEAGRATLAGLAAHNDPTLPWSFLEAAQATTARTREATAGAVARVESRALIDALAAHNRRLDNVLTGLGVMLGELSKPQGDKAPAPEPVRAEAEPEQPPHYPDGFELPDRQVPSAHDAE